MVQRFFVLIILVVLIAGLAFAQSNNGEIAGSVHDPQGAVVPGAKITITSAATGLLRTATTPDNGFVSLPRTPRRDVHPHGGKIRICGGEDRGHRSAS